MTAVALDMFRQESRAATQPREQAPKQLFSSLMTDQPAKAPIDPAKQMLDGDGQAQNDALLALLERIPQGELPDGGVPEALATDVSVVIEIPVELQEETRIAADSVIAEVIPQLIPQPVRAIGSGLLPIAIEDEISDGIPQPLGAARPQRRDTDFDEEAPTMAIPINPAAHELHARTLIAIPMAAAPQAAQAKIAAIPGAPAVVPELAARPTAIAPNPVAAALAPVAELPLTPLEQAVQDLILDLSDRDEPIAVEAQAPTSVIVPDVKLLAVEHADAPAPVALVKDPQPLPEQTNPSHVHLVIDDGAERLVVTVAVRGSEVNVALRGQDDATTAALARNAGSLDHAMRARGLDLAGLMTGRDPESQKQRPDREHRDPRNAKQELFSIEELA